MLRRLAEHALNPAEDYPLLVADLQTIILSTSLSFQRTARGLRPT